jgi:HK97 family phage portal protein
MGVLQDLASFLVPSSDAPPLEVRSSDPWTPLPTLEQQLARLHNRGARPWRTATIPEALGVPAIFRAVLLISNTVGSLSMEAWRDELMLSAKERPRLIIRPNPLTTPREFYRDTAYAMATRGEAWWWVAARDIDGAPISLYPVPPFEVTVEENSQNRLRPTIRWRDEIMPNEDMKQIVLTKEPGALRGAGPLQVCGAAVSVAVEAQEYAADFFAGGGLPSALIKSALKLNEEEALALKAQWMETPSNMPKVVDPGIESVEPFDSNPASAQLTEQRQYQNGDAARMFGIPGELLEYNSPGSSLTYQNVGEVWVQFQRATLSPDYLEPIEQAMSDLLARATISRFDLDGLLRADVKTRYEVHKSAIESGVYDAAYAQQIEGIEPGSVETAPIPLSPPQAVPNILPFQARSQEVRCHSCRRLLSELATPPYRLTCPRCKTVNENLEIRHTEPALDAVDGLKLAINELRDPPSVVVQPSPIPEINVQAAAAPDVEVIVRTDSFVDAIRDLKEALAAPRRRTVIRDADGRIVGVEEVA